jgi:hypothetical protein
MAAMTAQRELAVDGLLGRPPAWGGVCSCVPHSLLGQGTGEAPEAGPSLTLVSLKFG